MHVIGMWLAAIGYVLVFDGTAGFAGWQTSFASAFGLGPQATKQQGGVPSWLLPPGFSFILGLAGVSTSSAPASNAPPALVA
jgi:hypothetical protein